MGPTELLLASIRWLHGLAAVAWIGAILFELVALPEEVIDSSPSTAVDRLRIARWDLAQTALYAFLITGAVLTFDRLTRVVGDWLYVALLAGKIALVLAMFHLAFRWRFARGQERSRALRWQASFGVAILFLAALLTARFEHSLAP